MLPTLRRTLSCPQHSQVRNPQGANTLGQLFETRHFIPVNDRHLPAVLARRVRLVGSVSCPLALRLALSLRSVEFTPCRMVCTCSLSWGVVLSFPRRPPTSASASGARCSHLTSIDRVRSSCKYPFVDTTLSVSPPPSVAGVTVRSGPCHRPPDARTSGTPIGLENSVP
eukprot:3889196-Rhodomonas_salina.3